jgi:hypothetical protein
LAAVSEKKKKWNWRVRVKYDLDEKRYDPSQPRVPAGDSQGGQWTSGGGDGGQFDKSTHRKVANAIEKDVPGFQPTASIDRSRSKFEARLVSKKKGDKRTQLQEWLRGQGFEEFKDPMKSEYFYNTNKGSAWRNGKFQVNISLYNGYTWADIIDNAASRYTPQVGQD